MTNTTTAGEAPRQVLFSRRLIRKLLAVQLAFALLPQVAKADPPHPTGLVPVDRDTYRGLAEAADPLPGLMLSGSAPKPELPRSVDLSASLPRPGNQGQQGSCVAWAVSYGLRSLLATRSRGWVADQHAFSPSYVFNQLSHAGSCWGSSIVDALTLIQVQGVLPVDSFPYDSASCSAVPSPSQRQSASEYRISGFEKVPLAVAAFKKTLANGDPIVIAMWAGSTFQSVSDASVYSGPRGSNPGGHAVLVVGYNDDLSAFRVLNSWGTGWGDGGYCWMSQSLIEGPEVFEAYKASDNAWIPQETAVTDNDFERMWRNLSTYMAANRSRGYRGWVTGMRWKVGDSWMRHYAVADDPKGWGPYPRSVRQWIQEVKQLGKISQSDTDRGFSNTKSWIENAHWAGVGKVNSGGRAVGALPNFLESSVDGERMMEMSSFGDVGVEAKEVPRAELNLNNLQNSFASAFMWAKGHGYAGGYPALWGTGTGKALIICFKSGYLREGTVPESLLEGR